MTDDLLVYTGLEIFIRGPAAEAINPWRQRYDPASMDLEPHISLAYPPFVPLELWPQVKPAVLACLQGIAPFRVVLKEPGTFPPASPQEPGILWLKPEDGGLTASIRRALEIQLPAFVPPMPFPYVPHVTLGFFQGNDLLQQAFTRVQAELRPIEFTVSEIIYEVDNRVSGLRFIDALPLGAQANRGAALPRKPRLKKAGAPSPAHQAPPAEPFREAGEHGAR